MLPRKKSKVANKIKPFTQRILAEGTINDRKLVATEITEEAKRLARKLPVDRGERTVYVRNLVSRCLEGKLDFEVFKRFMQMTNVWVEVETCLPRAKMLLEKEKMK